MEYSSKFWDKIADKYAARPVADEDTYQRKLAITREYLRPDMDVLEFGCGTGSTALVHAPYVRSYTASDLSEEMIRIAKSKLQDNPQKNLNFEVATMEDYAARKEQFDAILGLNILHLLPDPQKAIQQAAQLLKPGGVLVTSTACLKDTMPWIRFIAPIGRTFGFMPYLHMLSRNEMETWLTEAGFEMQVKWVPEQGRHVYFIVALKQGSH